MAPDTANLPRHPVTGLYAIGLLPGARPIWPCLGGDDSADAAAQAAAAKTAADKVAAEKAAADAAAAQRGYPANTRVEDMTAEQQAAYWKHDATTQKERASAFGNLTVEQLAELRAKATKADELEAEKGTDTEKAVRSAHTAAEQAADAKYQPLLVQAEFRAVSAGRIEPEKLATILAPLNLSAFLAADGTPDTAKVTAYVDGIAPAKEKQRGPGANDAGARRSADTGGSAADRARRRAERLGVVKPAAQQ